MSSSSAISSMAGLTSTEVDLFQAVFTYLLARVGPKVSFDEVVRLTELVLKGMGPDARVVPDWNAAAPSRIEAAKRPSNLIRPLRIAVTIAEVREPAMVLIPNADGSRSSVLANAVRVIDRAGDSIWTLDILGEELSAKLIQLKKSGGTVEILCAPVALPGKLDAKTQISQVGSARRSFFIHVVDLRSSSSSLDLLGATADERERAQAELEQLLRIETIPGEFLLGELVKGLNIVALEEFPMLEDILQFELLQALSTGRVDHAPARLHCMVVGPPGAGKKLIGLAAKVLNPVTSEMSPIKASPAGLVGASHHTADGWKSTPGCIPLAAGGVAILQDAHGWDPSTVRKLAPVLQEILEDGVVRDSVAGGRTRVADTSIVIDLNRSAQVGLAGVEAPILQVRPLLSRIDAIFEIPEDVNRAWSVARRLYSSVQTGSGDLEEAPWVRRVRLLVALLRDLFPVIDVSPVRDQMVEVHDEIWSKNEPVFAHRPDAGDVPVRLAITMTRLVAASARARGSSVASPFDVQFAAKFLSYKLEFLQLHGASEEPSVGTDQENGNRAWVALRASGVVKTQDLVAQYHSEMGSTVSEKTIRRHLLALGGRRIGKGVYSMISMPTASMAAAAEIAEIKGIGEIHASTSTTSDTADSNAP